MGLANPFSVAQEAADAALREVGLLDWSYPSPGKPERVPVCPHVRQQEQLIEGCCRDGTVFDAQSVHEETGVPLAFVQVYLTDLAIREVIVAVTRNEYKWVY